MSVQYIFSIPGDFAAAQMGGMSIAMFDDRRVAWKRSLKTTFGNWQGLQVFYIWVPRKNLITPKSRHVPRLPLLFLGTVPLFSSNSSIKKKHIKTSCSQLHKRLWTQDIPRYYSYMSPLKTSLSAPSWSHAEAAPSTAWSRTLSSCCTEGMTMIWPWRLCSWPEAWQMCHGKVSYVALFGM